MGGVEILQSGIGEAGQEFSYFALFLQSHIVVKIVMIGLLAASVWSWAIIADKWITLARTRQHMRRFEIIFWSGQPLEELYQKISKRGNIAFSALFVAAMREWKRSLDGERPAKKNLAQRIDRAMSVTLNREIERMERRLLFLASVGSSAPFVGLFGTVWGIMTSFQAIAISKNTNLAVVAPGIAEALFATALGLLAAIPAVIGYNKLSREAANLAGQMENFSDEFSAILSRRLDADDT